MVWVCRCMLNQPLHFPLRTLFFLFSHSHWLDRKQENKRTIYGLIFWSLRIIITTYSFCLLLLMLDTNGWAFKMYKYSIMNPPPLWLCSIAKHLQFTFPWGLSVLKMYFHIWHQPDLVYPIMKPNVLHQEGQRCWWVGHYKCLRFGCTSCITEGFILTLSLWMFSFCPSIFVSIV